MIKNRAVQGRPYSGKISFALARNLLVREQSRSGYYEILDAIDLLEGVGRPSITKAASQFSSPPLFPLWHKHFAGARSIAENLRIQWAAPRYLEGLIYRANDESNGDPDLFEELLAHKLTIQSWEDRVERGVTGNWLIFARNANENHYLVAVPHGKKSSDNALHQKIVAECFCEQPGAFPNAWERGT